MKSFWIWQENQKLKILKQLRVMDKTLDKRFTFLCHFTYRLALEVRWFNELPTACNLLWTKIVLFSRSNFPFHTLFTNFFFSICSLIFLLYFTLFCCFFLYFFFVDECWTDIANGNHTLHMFWLKASNHIDSFEALSYCWLVAELMFMVEHSCILLCVPLRFSCFFFACGSTSPEHYCEHREDLA